MATFTLNTLIHSPPQDVWRVLSDFGKIFVWNPGVKDSHATNPQQGLGGARHCDLHGKKYLKEDVVEWEEEKKITFRVVETNLPFKTAEIRFFLAAEKGGTRVTVSPTYQLKFGIIGKMMDALMVRKVYRKGMRDLLQGLKAYLESGNFQFFR